jgi:hypothetical protein
MADFEPTNLVLEQLRAMRAEATAFRAETSERFDRLESEIKGIKTEMRGLKLQSIAEIYKANLTVASFADLDARLRVVEQKVLP